MDHYLFLHLIAFIIQKYSAFNDNKALLLRRPNTIYIIASWCCSAQLLGTAFLCAILPPWQRGMLRPGGCTSPQITLWPGGKSTLMSRGAGQSPPKLENFPKHPCFLASQCFSLWQPARRGCFCSSWGRGDQNPQRGHLCIPPLGSKRG